MKKNIAAILVWLVCRSLFTTPAAAQSSARYADNSVLASGRWVKISVDKSGIFQLSYNDLRECGFSDPSRVALFGYGGAMLPEDFSAEYIDDLPQVPTLHTGNKLIFYAQGPVEWSLQNNLFARTRNPYSMRGCYFLTQLDTPPLAPESEPSAAVADAATVTTFHDYILHEQELANPGHMGRSFYGENFLYTNVQDFTFDVPGVTETPVNLQVKFLAKSTSAPSSVRLTVNRVQLDEKTIAPVTSDAEYKMGAEAIFRNTFVRNPDAADVVRLSFSGSTATSAYLDYILLDMERELRLYGGYVAFRHKEAASRRLRYRIAAAGASAPHVWDVTVPYAPREIEAERAEGFLSFVPSVTALRQYVAFDAAAAFPTPVIEGTVSNQNLHALANVDFVIVAAPPFVDEARRLGEFHRQRDTLSYIVVQPAAIYNEFSSGTSDATAIRRFMKMFYDRAGSDESLRPKYLLLFGDGSYDNPGVTPEWQSYRKSNANPFLLTFQGSESLDERSNFVTDDYFGFLHDDEGADLYRASLDVGIGRIPARTKNEAAAVVDKIIAYAENRDFGHWKNDICLVADDGNAGTHMQQCEDLASLLGTKDPAFFIHKIYIDAYNRVSLATGGTYPDAKAQMLNLLKKDGALVIDYVGHGSARGWTAEKILEWSDISNMYVSRLPLWITATCSFCRFDDLSASGAEELFLNPKGGGIALISTARVVYVHANGVINKAIVQHLFDRDADGRVIPLGDVVRRGKNGIASNANDVLMNRLNYVLLGDPALRLSVPSCEMAVTAINEVPITDTPDDIELNARSWVTVTGEVRNRDGERIDDFDGLIYPRLYDSERKIVTAGNGNDDGSRTPYTFWLRDNMLYTGRDSVRNGTFEFTFKMPRELNYSNEPGLFNLYACDALGREAQGMSDRFVVGGMDAGAEPDTDGPKIQAMYLNASDFRSGDEVNETPVFVATVEDESGINISGIGLGHDMTVCIDGDPRYEYVVNDYFVPATGHFGRGDVYYELPELSAGNHSLVFTVWDTDGNSSRASLDFVVKKGLKPQIYKLYPEQSPVSDVARFYLQHDRPGMLMTIKLSVFNWSGREVWSTESTNMSELWCSAPIEWPLTDNAGRRVPGGVYLYRAVISVNGGSEATKTQKIMVLPQ